MVAALLLVFGLFQFGQDGFSSFQSAPKPNYYSTEVTARQVSAVDGDTVRVPGETRSIRLVGFNTPEVSSPECSREAQVGRQAERRLSELLQTARSIEFEKVRCSCQPGTEGTPSAIMDEAAVPFGSTAATWAMSSSEKGWPFLTFSGEIAARHGPETGAADSESEQAAVPRLTAVQKKCQNLGGFALGFCNG